MIRKIKTNINGTSTNERSNNEQSPSSNNSYDTESKNAQVEELDLNAYSNENTSSTSTIIQEETVLNAIEQNFANNRNLTNEMNNKVYSALNDKIAQYIANNGGNI